jgi:hypothetical protein
VPILCDLLHLAPLSQLDLVLCPAASCASVFSADVAEAMRRWAEDAPMINTVRLGMVTVLLVLGLFLAIIGDLEGNVAVSFLGIAVFSLMSTVLVAALLMGSLRGDRDVAS